jgi:hypothetical protein
MKTKMQLPVITLFAASLALPAFAQTSRFDELANLPFKEGFLSKEGIATLQDEMAFQRAVQTYLWALPALNMYGIKRARRRPSAKATMSCPSSRTG